MAREAWAARRVSWALDPELTPQPSLSPAEFPCGPDGIPARDRQPGLLAVVVRLLHDRAGHAEMVERIARDHVERWPDNDWPNPRNW